MSSSKDESGSEYSSSSEEEAPRRLLLRPKFIPKSQRDKSAGAGPNAETQPDEEAAQARRLAATDALIEEQIKKNLEARASGKKHWEDDKSDAGSDAGSDVDTTDGLDPEAEEAAWRLRELKRLKRGREAIEAHERELAEMERRRNLTEEERAAEDDAHLARQREAKESRGKMAYMQKYFHGGAFYREEADAAGLLNRDIMGSRIIDDIRDRSVLPEYLQQRDQTKIGRKGATKYKDMRTEDTGRWGDLQDHRPGRGAGERFSGRDIEDERFRPDWGREGGDGEGGAKGANAIPLGDRRSKRDDGVQKENGSRGGAEKDRSGGEVDRYRSRNQHRSKERHTTGKRARSRSRERVRSRDRRSSRDRQNDRQRDYRGRDDSREERQSQRPKDRDRDHRHDDSRERWRSRSRSPRRDDSRRRKRSISRERERHQTEKRRRVDAR